MSLYRVMVSGKKDYWKWIDVEADSELQAEEIAASRFKYAEANSSDTMEITIESVELLDDRPSKASDEVWIKKENST